MHIKHLLQNTHTTLGNWEQNFFISASITKLGGSGTQGDFAEAYSHTYTCTAHTHTHTFVQFKNVSQKGKKVNYVPVGFVFLGNWVRKKINAFIQL